MHNTLPYSVRYPFCKAFIVILLFCTACRSFEDKQLEQALSLAGSNRPELEKVIRYYQTEHPDELKLKAARFLIANIPGHYSADGDAFRWYQEQVHCADSILNKKQLNELWEKATQIHSQRKDILQDIHTLHADFLIDNIEKAFETWKASPWKSEVDFDSFCRHILPYRFLEEQLAAGWRDSFYNEYHPLIENVKDVKQAFAVIQNMVGKQVKSNGLKVPYIINVLDMKHQNGATCIQRCVLIGSVMRALGIPVAIDNVGRWSNYSQSGHAWVALVLPEGTFTVYEQDSIARRPQTLDASTFKMNAQAQKDFPEVAKFKKRYAKIRRSDYALQEVPASLCQMPLPRLLTDPFKHDVTEFYPHGGQIELPAGKEAYAYLCTFTTAIDWEPICYAPARQGKYSFPNMGDSVVYLPATCKGKMMQPLEQPFLWANGTKHCFQPDTLKKQQLVLTRKYPLTGFFPDYWTLHVGGRIEGSMHKNFVTKEILHTFASTPGFRQRIDIDSTKAFRYIRFITLPNCGNPITEIECMEGSNYRKGNCFAEKVDNPEVGFDLNTFQDIKCRKAGYSLGLDFGKPQRLTHLFFYPRNDDNFIVPGNSYELFYYDMGWISMGKKVADGYSLIYEDAPSNAIFLLKNLTKGKEERIFSYEQNAQHWY